MSLVESHPIVSGLLLFGFAYLNSRIATPRPDRYRSASNTCPTADTRRGEPPCAGGPIH